MHRSLIVPALLLALAAPPVMAQDTEPRTVTVTGEGSVEAVPDMATITLGVTHEAESAKDAMGQTSQDVDRILGRLGGMGIESRDMQTSGITLNPVWSNYDGSDRNRITGFSASNTVTVRVRALDSLGGILDAVVEDGANQFNSLQFGVQDPDPLRDEALRRAIADGRDKAQLMSESAEVKLGDIRQMTEQYGGGNGPVMMEMAAARMSVPVAAGEVSVTATVQMVFQIGG